MQLRRVSALGLILQWYDHGTPTDLQPGERSVVVCQLEAFQIRCGNGLPVAGEVDTGQLSNGGEQLRLVPAMGR